MLLDTDVLIDLQREHPPAETWFDSLTEQPTISGIAALELVFGAASAAELRRVREFLEPLPILWPSEEDARAAFDLATLHLAHGIGLLDSITATLALRHGLPVATFNERHFRAVPDLTTLQPYER